MERLTHERVNGIKSGYWSAATKETLVQRLAAYEETGLTPEEIKDIIAVGSSDLAKMLRTLINNGETEHMRNILTAEAEGRLMVLPCAVGDKVWIPGHKFASEIETIVINREEGLYFEYAEYDRSYELTECWDEGNFTANDIGKTVFLTREEAEAALEGESNG